MYLAPVLSLSLYATISFSLSAAFTETVGATIELTITAQSATAAILRFIFFLLNTCLQYVISFMSYCNVCRLLIYRI